MLKQNELDKSSQMELESIRQEADDFVSRVLMFCERQNASTPETSSIVRAMQQSSIALRSTVSAFVILVACSTSQER